MRQCRWNALSYATLLTGSDDTLASIAERMGSDPAAIAAFNHLDPQAPLRADRPLVVPVYRAGNDDGTLYSVMRRIPPAQSDGSSASQKSLGGKLIVQSAEPAADGMQLRREPRGAVDSADISGSLIGDNTACLASAPDAKGNPMRLVLDENDFSYHEADVIDVGGRLAVPPLQWYLPGPRASLLYTSQTWLVEGALVGKHVRGFLFWEQAWMLPGGRLYVEKDPLLEKAVELAVLAIARDVFRHRIGRRRRRALHVGHQRVTKVS